MSRARLLITCVALFGCSDYPGGGGRNVCSTGIAVTAGTTPRFSWAPGCRIQSLQVSAGSACGARFYCWSIEAVQQNGISSSVTYGTVPGSATETAAPVTLQAGTQYTVSIDHFDAGARVTITSQSFTP